MAGRADALLFDLDGTLVKLQVDFAAQARAVAELAERKYGVRVASSRVYAVLAEFRAARPDLYRDFRAEAYELLKAYEPGSRPGAKVEPDPRAVEILRGLRSDGYRLALVTNNSRETVDNFLREVPEIFDASVSRDEAEELKPSPEPLLRALALLGARPACSAMVGDSPVDVLAARAAGVVSVLKASAGGAVGSEPDYVIADLSYLRDALRDMEERGPLSSCRPTGRR